MMQERSADSPTPEKETAEPAAGRPCRRLAPHAPSHLVRSLCQAVFAAELLDPGAELWMVVRRVWNVPLLDNRANTFRHLEPTWPQDRIRMLSILRKLMREGVDVRILTEDVPSNQTFAGEFQSIEQGRGSGRYREIPSWEGVQEGVAASSFYLQGGLQLSRKGGLSVVGQELCVYTDEASIARGRRVFQRQWEEQSTA